MRLDVIYENHTDVVRGLLAFLAALVGFLIVVATSTFCILAVKTSKAPSDIPWVGLRSKRIFPRIRAALRELSVGQTVTDEAWDKYIRHGKPCIVPTLMLGYEVLLPPSDTVWLATQPEHVLSANKLADEVLGLKDFASRSNPNTVHWLSVTSRNLTRQLLRLVPETLADIAISLDAGLGSDTSTLKDVKIFKVFRDAAEGAANRAFVGAPFCVDKGHMKAMQRASVVFSVSVALLYFTVPEPLHQFARPVVARWLTFVDWLGTRKLVARIRQYLRETQSQHDQKSGVSSRGPRDVMQSLLQTAVEAQDSATTFDLSNIAGRTLLLANLATDTTTMTLGILLADILTYVQASELLDELREEAKSILPRLSFSPRLLRETPKLDSVLRESLRFSTPFGRFLIREVLVCQGLTTPSGIYLPHGSHASCIVGPMHRDNKSYIDAMEFQPMRFYKGSMVGRATSNASNEPRTPWRQLSAVQIDEHYLSFGLGTHACPGRFYAIQTIKLIMLYLLVHYDLEPWKERPKFTIVGEASFPPQKAKAKVRRRESAPTADVKEG